MSDVLIRLYDVAPGRERLDDGTIVRAAVHHDLGSALRCVDGDGGCVEQLRLAFATEPVSAAVAAHDGAVTACCVFNVTTRGRLGPLFARRGTGVDVQDDVARLACGLMSRASYWYAVVDKQIAGEWTARLADCSVAIPDRSCLRSVRQRDVVAPHADLFLELDDDLGFLHAGGGRPGANRFHVHRPPPSYRLALTRWVQDEFGDGWASEIECAFDRTPIGVFFASLTPQLRTEDLQGFMAYGVTSQGTTGPIGLRMSARGGFVVAAILLDRCLRELYLDGFRYAILGGVSRRRAVLRGLTNAWAIPGSYPARFPSEAGGEAGA